MMWTVDLCTSLWPQAGLAFDRSMADLLCHRSFFRCKDDTLNVWINNNNRSVSTGNVTVCPCSYLCCVWVVTQCVLCLYPLYSASPGLYVYVPSMLSRPCAWLCDLDICLQIFILFWGPYCESCSISIQFYVVSMWCIHENGLFLSLKVKQTNSAIT